MKRFYKDVAVIASDQGFAVQLDARPVRTPARALLALPTPALADAVAAEWRAQGESVDPATMPFTGLANAAIDHVVANHKSFAAGIARYGESDLLCYRAEAPQTLVQRQAAAWDPLLDWARARYDVAFVVEAFDPFLLAGLSTLVNLSGSLICGLAIVDGGHDLDDIWQAAEIDEAWQVEQWGEDAQAAARNARRAADFAVAGAFCGMSRP